MTSKQESLAVRPPGRSLECSLAFLRRLVADSPQPFQRVVDALLRVLDVHHDVAEVEQDPSPLTLTLPANRLGAQFEHPPKTGTHGLADRKLAGGLASVPMTLAPSTSAALVCASEV